MAAFGALALGACGQKGPLVLPPTKAEQSKPAKPDNRPYPDVPSTSDKQ